MTVRSTERFIQESEHELYPDQPREWYSHLDCRVCGPGPLKREEVPSAFPHVFYRTEKELRNGEYSSWEVAVRRPCGPSDAQVVSSEIEGRETHSVMLDIDMPARLIESSTPGHHHLYIDKELTWRKYKKLLRALRDAGLIEEGYYKASIMRKGTHLRPPWEMKEVSDESQGTD